MPAHRHAARDAARANGERTYVGSRCKRGHDGLRYTGTTNCVACQRERDRIRWRPDQTAKRSFDSHLTAILGTLRWRAKRKGLPFALTHDDLKAVWPKDDRCPVLGIPMQRQFGRQGGHPNSPSIDRINPAAGYVPGNIAVMSYLANRIKTDGTSDQVAAVAAWMKAQGL